VREYYLNSALHWLEEYRVDGFGMDATGFMTLQDGGWSLMQELNDMVGNRFAGKVVLANFANIDHLDYRTGLPQPGDWWEFLNSQDTLYAGSGLVNSGQLSFEDIAYDGYGQSVRIDLPGMGLVVLKKGVIPTAADEEQSPASPSRLYPAFPNPFNPTATIRFSLAEPGLAVYTNLNLLT